MSSCILQNSDKNISDVELHHLPCKINADEVANVESFFNPITVSVDQKNTLKASFRGRPLDGILIEVPKSYCGYVLTEKKQPYVEETNRNLEVVGKFNCFTQWYLDSQYYSNDSIIKVCNLWPSSIAKAIHDPIEPDC